MPTKHLSDSLPMLMLLALSLVGLLIAATPSCVGEATAQPAAQTTPGTSTLDPSQPPPATPSADLQGNPVAANEPGIDSVRDVVVAAKAGRWRVVIALGLIALVWGSRKVLSSSAKLKAYLHDDLWGTLYAFAVTALSYLGTALGTDVAIDRKLWMATFSSGLLAVGGYSVLWKKLLKPLAVRLVPALGDDKGPPAAV